MPIDIQGYLAPSNEGLDEYSRNFRKNTVATIQRQQRNAVNSSPYPVFFYRINRHGLHCSCNGEDTDSNLTESGDLRSDVINSILSGNNDEVEDAEVTLEQNPDYLDIYEENPIFMIDGPEDDTDMIAEVVNSEVKNDPNEIDIDSLSVLGTLSMVNVVSCPICLGSNFSDGLNLIDGSRITLHAENTLTLSNAHLHGTDYPTSIGLDVNGYVDYEVTLPKSAKVIDSVRIWNDKDNIELGLIDVDTNTAITRASLLQLCDGKKHTIRVLNNGTEHTQFTHVELQTSFNDIPLMANIGQVPDPEEINALSIPLTTSVTLERMIEVRKGDIMTDAIHNKAWVVQSATYSKDSDGNIFSVAIEVRVVQEFEVYNILPRPEYKKATC